jgi:hypothetical protein
MSVALLSTHSARTPINKLVLPPVNVIEGKVIKIDGNGFVLQDDTGSIYVKAELPGIKNWIYRKMNKLLSTGTCRRQKQY